MKNPKKFLLISTIVISLLILGSIAVYAKYVQDQPVLLERNDQQATIIPATISAQTTKHIGNSPPLVLSTSDVSEDSVSSNVQSATDGFVSSSVQASTKGSASRNLLVINDNDPKIRTYCGGPPVMYILGIGADSGVDYYYGLADIIRLVRVDFVTPKVTVLSLSRDLWVEIPDIQHKYNITHGKLNQAYFYGGPGMGYYSGTDGGPGLLSRTINYNFGIKTDHYGAINMQTFVGLVDALGGIDVVLSQSVDGRTDGRGYFYAGKNHLNGEQALNLVRIRYPYSDFIRQDHQTLVINAILAKFKDFRVFLKLPKIIQAFEDSVLTDLSLTQIGQLICLYPKLDNQSIVFTQLPPETMTASSIYSPQQKDNTFILKADFNAIRQYLDQFEAGTWP